MENNQPLVSVIMNCYNSDTYLKEAIDSVLAQTYTNWEIIFWDNQSTDKSAEIVKSYDDERIKYFYAPKHTLLGEARNLAVEKANGEWIGFLDCDDIWDKDKINIYINEYFKNKDYKEVALIYSKTYIINKNNKIIKKNEKILSGMIHDNLLGEGDFIVFSSVVLKKSSLEAVGKINEVLTYCEDYDLLLKITRNSKSLGINKFLTYYRMHTENITSKKLYQNNVEVVDFLEKYILENKTTFQLKILVYINNSYRIASLFFKLFLNKDKSILRLYKYYKYFLFSPFSILYIKVRNLI